MKRTVPSSDVLVPLATTRSAADAASAESKVHSRSLLSGTSTRAPATWPVTQASAGDHAAIHQFLLSVAQQPLLAEFQAQLEHPSYEPSDRLLIKRQRSIIAHLQLIHREIQFGSNSIPISVMGDLVVEHPHRGCEVALLAAARAAMIRNGSVLSLLRTNGPAGWNCRHWSICRGHHRSTATPRQILSHLADRQERESGQLTAASSNRRDRKYNIRLWRHIELAALPRLYAENTEQLYGPLVRSHSYWRWLANRGGNEHIYVAIDGPDEFELDESLASIVGYAATQEGRILEIMCATGHRQAATQLLSRACGDAIERGIERIEVDAPVHDPLHDTFAEAGGKHTHRPADSGTIQIVDLLKPQRLVRLLGQALRHRLQAAGLPSHCELGILVDDKKTRLSIQPGDIQWKAGNLGRSYLRCSSHDLAPLLLGHLDVPQSIETGRLVASTRLALKLATALFPTLPLWLPPWDDLPA